MEINSKRNFQIETENRKFNGLTKDSENKWDGSFSFIQAADTQFGLIDRYIKKKTDDITWHKEIHYLRLTIQSINSLTPKPKFMVICGDLVDAYPEPSPHYPHPDLEEIRKEQIKDLKEVLTELDSSIKMICVCGNHDVGDIPTIESIRKYRDDFGDDYFSFWKNGCKFITLNSQMYWNSSKIPDLKKEQDDWLDNELICDSTQHKHLVIFQHIPLFTESYDEPTHIYFNIEKEQRKNLIERFRNAGVKKVFCGHYHKNAVAFHEDFECITTSAIGAQLGDDGHGYRIVQVDENDITHKYIRISEEIN